jgi:ABC-2 type transport system ATP-binding protein
MLALKEVGYKIDGKTIFQAATVSLEKGKIVALLGENGVGKTTLLRLVAGLAKGYTGTITVEESPLTEQTKAIVSYLVNPLEFPGYLTIAQYLTFYERFYVDYSKSKAQDLLTFMELSPTMKLRSLSKGQNEKLALVATLARNAKIYLLDEPLGGVDLLAREKIIQSLVRFFSEESLLVITTHQMSEIEQLVDTVVIIKDQTIMQEDLEEIREKKGLSLQNYYRQVMEKNSSQQAVNREVRS